MKREHRPLRSSAATMPITSAIYFFTAVIAVVSAAVKYDQAQTGDYNVHLDLKNIEVLAFLDGSSLGLGDYEYDYGEYTVKPPPNATNGHGSPPQGPVPSPSSSTVLDNSTLVSEVSNSTEPSGIKELDTNTTESNQVLESTTKPPRRCGAGFYRDPAGRCRRLRRPIKLVGLLNQAKNRISGK